VTQPPLVLIVDDNEQNAKLARDVLRADGLETLTATTAAEAIALAREHLPDVILMDMRLPDMTGADAARTLAAGTRTATIPVVALSALRLDDRDWLVAGGFAGYLEKPIDVAQFPHEVRCYCARATPAPR
jgi:two-component system cell cycle response regulator DivK